MPYDKLEEALLEVVRTTCKNYIKQIDSKSLSKEIATKNNKKEDSKEKIKYLENKIKEYISKLICYMKINLKAIYQILLIKDYHMKQKVY